MKELETNLKILKELGNFFRRNPDVRFIQGLWALNIFESATKEEILKIEKEKCGHVCKDKFYEESASTLEKLKS